MYHMLGGYGKIVDNDFSSRLPGNQEQELNEIAGRSIYFWGRIRESIQSVIELEKQKQRTEMMALQLQMNPHFFCNGLSIVQYTLEEMDRYRESTAISYFSRILEYNMHPEVLAAIGKRELECVKKLCGVCERFPSPGMEVDYRVNEALMDLRSTEEFILQPFAEECGKYGDGRHLIVYAAYNQESLSFR